MALTKRQEITLYQVLGVPYGLTVTKIQDEDNMLGLTKTAQTYNACHSKIQASLASLASDLETELVDALDQWYEMLGDSTRMEGGTVGGTNGVSFDLTAERNMLRERILVIIPYSREHMAEEIGRMERDRIAIGVIR